MALTYLSGGRIQGEIGSTLSLDTSYSTNTVRHDMFFLNTGHSNLIASDEYAGNVIDTNHESIGKKLTSVTYRLNQTGTDNTDRPVVKLYTTGGVHKSTFTCEMNYGDMPSTANYVTNVEFKWSSNESGQDNEVDEDDEMRLYATDLASATLRIFSCDQSSETTAAKLHETENGTENTGAFYPCEIQYDEPNKIIDGSDTVLIFRKSGTFTPSANFNVEVLVVGGGGAGGAGSVSGGGGAGGMSEKASHSVTSGTAYSVIVGEGGKAGVSGGVSGDSDAQFKHRSQNGENSTFDGIISQGGGAGSGVVSSYRGGFDGGSGGGTWYGAGGTGGSSTQGNTNGATGYGEAGGISDGGTYTTGGGGGANEVGRTWNNGQSRGGNGRQNNITGVNKYYAGGGGGSVGNAIASGLGGKGGLGGGGQGTDGINITPASNKMLESGVNGLGGGGGGNNNEKRWGMASGVHNFSQHFGEDGGDGVVILRFSTSGNTYTATFDNLDSDADLVGDVPIGTLFEDTRNNRIYRKTGTAITLTSREHMNATNRGLGQDISGQVTKFGMQVYCGSVLIGKTIKSVSFWLWKGSSPTGNGYMSVMDGHGKIVANSTNTVDWSTLSSSGNVGTKHTFNFNGHKVRELDQFHITGGSTSTSNIVYVGRNASNNSDHSNGTSYWNGDDFKGYADEPVRYEITYGNGWVEKGVA